MHYLFYHLKNFNFLHLKICSRSLIISQRNFHQICMTLCIATLCSTLFESFSLLVNWISKGQIGMWHRFSLRLDQNFQHSTERPVWITDQPYMFIFSKLSQNFAMSRQKQGFFKIQSQFLRSNFLLNLSENDFLLRILNQKSNFHKDHF